MAIVINVGIVRGAICLKIILELDAPIDIAAETNNLSLISRTSALHCSHING